MTYIKSPKGEYLVKFKYRPFPMEKNMAYLPNLKYKNIKWVYFV